MALEIAPSGALVAAGRHINSGRVRAWPNRDARMTAPREMTKGRKSWLSTAHIFLLSYPLGQHEQEAVAMSKILDEVLAANAKYAENFGDKGNLPLPPSRHFAILTCMDAPLDPTMLVACFGAPIILF
jgi:hypothetical protein